MIGKRIQHYIHRSNIALYCIHSRCHFSRPPIVVVVNEKGFFCLLAVNSGVWHVYGPCSVYTKCNAGAAAVARRCSSFHSRHIYSAMWNSDTNVEKAQLKRSKKPNILRFFLSFSLVSYHVSKKVCPPLDKDQIYRVDVELEAHDGKYFFPIRIINMSIFDRDSSCQYYIWEKC